MRKLVLILSFLLLACQSQKPKKVDDDAIVRQRALMEELYLPLISSWSNGSDLSGCMRESDWLYLHLPKIIQKTSFEFKKVLNLQYQLNRLWHIKRPLGTVEFNYASRLTPSDRQVMLEQAIELVSGGVEFWSAPSFKNILLIDWDSVKGEERISFLRNILASPALATNLPVIISNCESSFSIKKFLEVEPDLLSFSFVIGVEMLTPFTNETNESFAPLHHPLEHYFVEGSTLTWAKPLSLKPIKPNKDNTLYL